MRDSALMLDDDVVEDIRSRFFYPSYEKLPHMPDELKKAAHDPKFEAWRKNSVFPHKEQGYAIVTLSLKPVGGPPGDATAEQMDAVADLADNYSFGEIRVGHEQNLALPHVARRDLPALWKALDKIGLATPNVNLVTDIIACPGLDYCSLANARSIPIAQELTRRFANHDTANLIGRLHINISGCINACGHHHVGHIGILGVEKNGEEFYQITIGGRADEKAELGTLIGPAVPYGEVADVVEDIVEAYLALRAHARRTVRRHGQASRRRTFQGARLCHSLRAEKSPPTLFVHVADDAELPGDGAVLVSAARFLQTRRRPAARRQGRRDLAEQSRRRRSGAVSRPARRGGAGVSDVSATAAPIARRVCCASAIRYRGELRATGQVLRDQFVFMLRAGFDAFEVKKQSDAEAFAADRQALFGVLPADRRWPHHRAAPADAVASFRECRPMNAVHPQLIREPTGRVAGGRKQLDRALRDASPAEVIAAALKTVGRERLALVSSFGTESAALLKVMADVDPAIPVVFLDTGWLFEETLAYRDTLIATLGLRDVRTVKPLEETLAREDPRPRIVVLRSRCLLPDPQSGAAGPRAEAVLGLDQRAQAFPGRRSAPQSPVVEDDGARLKFNPFANVSREEIEAIYRLAKLPPHPLVASGFCRLGCMPCTSRTAAG